MKKNETITVTYYIHNKYINSLSINKNKIDRFFYFLLHCHRDTFPIRYQ